MDSFIRNVTSNRVLCYNSPYDLIRNLIIRTMLHLYAEFLKNVDLVTPKQYCAKRSLVLTKHNVDSNFMCEYFVNKWITFLDIWLTWLKFYFYGIALEYSENNRCFIFVILKFRGFDKRAVNLAFLKHLLCKLKFVCRTHNFIWHENTNNMNRSWQRACKLLNKNTKKTISISIINDKTQSTNWTDKTLTRKSCIKHKVRGTIQTEN